MRFRTLLLLLALLFLFPGVPRAAERGPSRREVDEAIEEYFGADAARQGEILEILDGTEPLSKREAERALDDIRKAMGKAVLAEVREENRAEFGAFAKQGEFRVTAGGATMKYAFRAGGKRGRNGVPLFVNLHGGGDSASVNDSAYESAKSQYSVPGALVVPRATQDVALSWAVPEIWPLIDRLLAECFLLRGVDPDRVYLLGYSMGGWGTLLMAPAMADRFAAAGASAGGEHASRAHPENLRNLPIIIQIGTEDHPFHRYELTKAYADALGVLRAADPGGYVFEYREHPGQGHQISDRDNPKWMAEHVRDPYPEKVVWMPVDATGGWVRRFYWLGIDDPKGTMHVVATRKGNAIEIDRADGVAKLAIFLNDEMADLDEEIVVRRGDRELWRGRPERRLATLLETFAARADPRLAFPVRIDVAPSAR